MNEDEKNKEELNEVKDFQKADYTFTPKEVHEWRQQGPYLVCKSCELGHATYIGMEKILVGLDEGGRPILKSRASISG